MKPDLTDEETDALAHLLRDTIDADRYPLSQRVRMRKGILAKIEPETKPEPLPPLKHHEPPRAGDIGDDEGQLFRPTYDARECGICRCSPNRMVPPFREPHGFAGCLECHYQAEPATASLRAAEGGTSADPAEIARRYCPETLFREWRKRLVSSRCGSHDTDMVVTSEQRLKPKVRIDLSPYGQP
jgi:hypothetical protein